MEFQRSLSSLLLLLSLLTVAILAKNCTLKEKTGEVNCRGLHLSALPPLPPWSRKVDLSYNAIEHLPSLGNLTQLETLDFSHNKLSRIDNNAIQGCSALTTLDLSSNALTSVPSLTLSSPSSLTSLNLATNALSTISSISLKSFSKAPLESLNLSSTLKGQSYPSPIDGGALTPVARKLKILDLSNNSLNSKQLDTGLTPLYDGGLEKLILSASFLEPFGGFIQKLPELAVLTVTGCKIRSIDPTIFKGSRISSLDLRNNLIKNLPANAFSSIILKEMKLGGNPFQCNCELAWLHFWLSKANVSDKDDVICETPTALKNTKVIDWNVTGCDETTASPKVVTTTLPKTTTTVKPKTTTTVKPKTTTTVKPKTTTTIKPNPKTTTRPVSPTSPPKPTTTSAPSSGGHHFPWWGALLIVIAVTVFAIAIYVIIRRARRPRHDDALTPIVQDEEEGVTTRRSFLC